jgi:hypothetical protein
LQALARRGGVNPALPEPRRRRVRLSVLLSRIATSRAARGSLGRLREEALATLQAETAPGPAYVYRLVPVAGVEEGALRLDGRRLEASRLLPERGELLAVACCVATLGDRLEDRIRALFAERRASLALALDGLANQLLFALSDMAQDDMQAAAARQNLCMAGELRSGDPGLDLGTQGDVLELAGARAIGVSLSSGAVMHPLKSTSMVLGIGVDLPPVRWSRCDPCPSRPRCRLAQTADALSPAA